LPNIRQGGANRLRGGYGARYDQRQRHGSYWECKPLVQLSGHDFRLLFKFRFPAVIFRWKIVFPWKMNSRRSLTL
jgi:hypothetical protein